jgi:hypothetical protein
VLHRGVSDRGVQNRRNRILGAAIVIAIAGLSVGATAYAADLGHTRERTPVNAPTAAPSATPVAAAAPTPVPSPTVVPTPEPAVEPAIEPTVVPGADAAADPADQADGGAADEGPADGNVVEVRTPNPDAIPTTIAERAYFYGLITQCMATTGFDWQAEISATADGEFQGVTMTTAGSVDLAEQAAFTLALYGDTGAGDYYHWADAGCWGNAVHVTGNDGNN